VGAGNSGAEIAKELAAQHRVFMSGPSTGEVPFRVDGRPGLALLSRLMLRVVFHRVLTIRTPMGRKVRPMFTKKGAPLIRVKSKHLSAAGVERVARVTGVRDGLPVLEDGRVLDVANVIWCTGFHPGFSWIDQKDLAVMGADGEPIHDGGVVKDAPGLYFVGLHFLYSVSSAMIHGVSRDARRIVDAIAARARRRMRCAPRSGSRLRAWPAPGNRRARARPRWLSAAGLGGGAPLPSRLPIAEAPLDVADLELYAWSAGLLARDDEVLSCSNASTSSTDRGESLRGRALGFLAGFRFSALREFGRASGLARSRASI
jgi:hypothetical protein